MKLNILILFLFIACAQKPENIKVHLGTMNTIVLDSNAGQNMDYLDECWSYHDSICMNINHYKITNK